MKIRKPITLLIDPFLLNDDTQRCKTWGILTSWCILQDVKSCREIEISGPDRLQIIYKPVHECFNHRSQNSEKHCINGGVFLLVIPET